MRQVFPDKALVDIADDDMIYQLPNGFPDGPPAFWHHGAGALWELSTTGAGAYSITQVT
ncbi:DUF4159 domain-containing protein [Rubritalea profundi]|uniref:DUF4159 domain-containing protein n=1 Tax=Rubritalea profundi TaxID=1658618 RepID=UPI0013FD7F37|nr:DUF4159 domain-containing protein [Rubritalea profundi]